MNERNRKQEIIMQISALLAQLIDTPETPSTPKNEVIEKPIEMLTIKECTEVIKWLSEHTVRQLVAQDKIPYIRTGQGKRGKILISKTALLTYFGGAV